MTPSACIRLIVWMTSFMSTPREISLKWRKGKEKVAKKVGSLLKSNALFFLRNHRLAARWHLRRDGFLMVGYCAIVRTTRFSAPHATARDRRAQRIIAARLNASRAWPD